MKVLFDRVFYLGYLLYATKINDECTRIMFVMKFMLFIGLIYCTCCARDLIILAINRTNAFWRDGREVKDQISFGVTRRT